MHQISADYHSPANEQYLAPLDQQIITARERALDQGLQWAENFINRQYLVNLDVHKAVCPVDARMSLLRLFRVTKLIRDASEDVNEKLVSIYSALNRLGSSVLILVRFENNQTEFYLGTRSENASTAGDVLYNSLKGNFNGSKVSPSLRKDEIQQLMRQDLYRKDDAQKCVSSVTLVPSLRNEERENYVQGIEKLLDAMSGQNFTMLLIAEPMSSASIDLKKKGLEEMYSIISPFADTSLAYGVNSSHAVADGTFTSFAEGINSSVSNSTSQSQTYGTSDSTSYSTNSSSGFSSGGSSFNSGSSSSTSHTSSFSRSYSWSNSVSKGKSATTSSGENQTVTDTIGENRTFTIKHVNKAVTDLMQRIDDQLKRIALCESFGLWSTAAYFVSDDIQITTSAAATFQALVSGDETHLDKTYINSWNSVNSPAAVDGVLKSLANGMHPIISLPRSNDFDGQDVKPTVLVSGKELPIIMSLPRRSVPGVVVDSMAAFGRAVFNPDATPNRVSIPLGTAMHMGVEQPGVTVSLDIEEFRSHCFITGSTGSGKSNTTYHLIEQLVQHGIHFLVVEPAKGEYKLAFGALKDCKIFWTIDRDYPLLRVNPFSFPEGIHVLEHMDRLIEIFNACWPLYSAMPAILKSAVEMAYTSCGWDLVNSIHIDIGKGHKFPTFTDLLRELPNVIKASSYSAETKGDYTGALVTRVSSLTNGIMGQVFCSGAEVSAADLFDSNTVVDLSRVGASETKALLMGIMVMKLNEHRMSAGPGMNSNLKHITVLEEAHNLLRRDAGGGSVAGANVAGKSVQMITNSIAEMRSYGEGFIIVDQSPTAVDISAIKNTNTKIVMRLPESGDADAIGSSFALNDDQRREISRLPRGCAIVSQSGWLEPVYTHICAAGNIYFQPLRLASRENIGDAVNKFIMLALRQAESGEFNEELVIKTRLKDRRIFSPSSRNRYDHLLGLYRKLREDVEKNGSLTAQSKAEFIIRSIGCKELSAIFPIRKKNERNEQLHEMKRWGQKVANALLSYGDFGDKARRKQIATQLFIYMQLVVRDPLWVAVGQVLHGTMQK